MSSPTSTSSPSSPTDGTNGSGSSSQERGANYFLGFLITFLGLFIIFIVLGIVGSRRRLAARREAALNGSLQCFPDGVNVPPHLYENLFVIGEDKWSSIMPLSVRFWREEEERKSKSSPLDLQTLPPATPARRSTRYITGYIPSIFLLNRLPTHHENPSLQTQTETDPDSPGNIQVAVMIAMPSRDLGLRADHQPKSPDRLREYQIGNVSLPWQQRDLHFNS